MNPITALIAEDEPLLAQSLQRELGTLWPALHTMLASDGVQAVEKALAALPQLLFFDVRMPGQSGIEAAQEIAERWPPTRRLPRLVFITAYDEYAVQAFEQAAQDYIVKPVKTARLAQTLERIKPLLLASAAHEDSDLLAQIALAQADAPALERLRALLRTNPGAPSNTPRLRRIQAGTANQIVLVPIEQVAYFEAADKYVRVLTGIDKAERELLIRTPIKELLPQLDEQEFWQIHRSTIVRVSLITAVHRDEAGRLYLTLRGRPERLAISRVYAPLFKAM